MMYCQSNMVDKYCLAPVLKILIEQLHKNVRRNPYLAQVFYDLHLMDIKGSGIDRMNQVLLSNAKHIPIPFQGDDFVKFTINKRILKTEIISLINTANETFQLNT